MGKTLLRIFFKNLCLACGDADCRGGGDRLRRFRDSEGPLRARKRPSGHVLKGNQCALLDSGDYLSPELLNEIIAANTVVYTEEEVDTGMIEIPAEPAGETAAASMIPTGRATAARRTVL